MVTRCEGGMIVADRAIDIIRHVDSNEIGFQWFRSTLRTDYGLKDTLDYGHAVIDTAPKLDQYLHTYGPMIESQWKCVAPYLAGIRQPTLWIDYGCGQGLAGLLVNDLTQGRLFGMTRDVLLIEPSALALARSTAVYERIAPAAKVTSVCKRFDDLSENDVPTASSGMSLHLFSNSLDVLGFDPLGLLTKTLRAGRHTILSVSHDRDFNGGTPRIEGVKSAFENPAMASELTIHRSTLDLFTCDNPSQSKGAVWLCEFEVEDG